VGRIGELQGTIRRDSRVLSRLLRYEVHGTADVFTAAPQILTDHFVALADPKKNFAAQNVLPLVYKSAMTPQITSTLNAISAALTTNALLQMDTALDVQHASYSQVAAGFLKAVHLG
jgi:osmoprotectant transport system substrate-binding protein